jgi:hypothetical protein
VADVEREGTGKAGTHSHRMKRLAKAPRGGRGDRGALPRSGDESLTSAASSRPAGFRLLIRVILNENQLNSSAANDPLV